jgi:hypothetical protein
MSAKNDMRYVMTYVSYNAVQCSAVQCNIWYCSLTHITATHPSVDPAVVPRDGHQTEGRSHEKGVQGPIRRNPGVTGAYAL